MTQASFFSSIEMAASSRRFDPYRSPASQSDAEALGLYAWNIALCESLYPALNCLEISIRNSVHRAASRKFGVADWFRRCLSDNELKTLEGVEKRLMDNSKNTDADNIVANLSLGFWLALFRPRYEQALWPRLLKAVFPHCPRTSRTRKNICERLDKVHRLRNRVFHHEPIWRVPDLPERHRLILETIGWISPAMLAMTRLLDRFDSVYTGGAQCYAAELDSVEQNWSA